jgi:hypothetical protein
MRVGLMDPVMAARPAVDTFHEGLLASMAYCLDMIAAHRIGVEHVILVGGGARSGDGHVYRRADARGDRP